jgi:arsenate reductase (thioredoxin)
MTDHAYNVLFLCAANSARSILAECILNREGHGRFKPFSAGSQPKGKVQPLTLELLKKMNYPTAGLRSKSWDEFAETASYLNFVFAICDNAANEGWSIWPGQPITAHWGAPDPAAAQGTEAERHYAFAEAYRMLQNRISVFVSLPLRSIDRLSLRKRPDEIGRPLPKMA